MYSIGSVSRVNACCSVCMTGVLALGSLLSAHSGPNLNPVQLTRISGDRLRFVVRAYLQWTRNRGRHHRRALQSHRAVLRAATREEASQGVFTVPAACQGTSCTRALSSCILCLAAAGSDVRRDCQGAGRAQRTSSKFPILIDLDRSAN